MRVLVACEESQTVCIAFRERGHEAYSCDIQECSGGHPEWHYKRDALSLLNRPWDLVIAHPPCTYLTNAGVRHLHENVTSKNGVRAKVYGSKRWEMMLEGCEFFNQFVKYATEHSSAKVCIENPIPHGYARQRIGKYTQIVQPWMFGHPETKATCLWLFGLPNLKETNNVKELMQSLPAKERNRVHYMRPGPERAKLRSKTFKGIADAMADQWGNL